MLNFTQAQEKTTMNVSDLSSNATKYIKKNYKDYKTTEAFSYAQIFVVKIQKADTTAQLAFDTKDKFLYKLNTEMETAINVQQHVAMAMKDVDHAISKYVEKNYKDYKIIEALNYEQSYSAIIVKGADQLELVFDSKGNFLSVVTSPQD
jgi:hypothetical protein